jgi:hypothetical protein
MSAHRILAVPVGAIRWMAVQASFKHGRWGSPPHASTEPVDGKETYAPCRKGSP